MMYRLRDNDVPRKRQRCCAFGANDAVRLALTNYGITNYIDDPATADDRGAALTKGSLFKLGSTWQGELSPELATKGIGYIFFGKQSLPGSNWPKANIK